MVTWVVAQEYLKVTPRDLTVNMIKIDFLNEFKFVPKTVINPVLTFSQHLRKMEDDEGNAIEHNFRAPQDLNGRTIFNMGP